MIFSSHRNLNNSIAGLLFDRGLVAQADLDEAAAFQGHGGGSLASALIRLGVIGDETLAETIADASKLPLLKTAPAIDQVVAAQKSLRFSEKWLSENDIVVWKDLTGNIFMALASGMTSNIQEAIEHWQISPDHQFIIAHRMLTALLSDLEDQVKDFDAQPAPVRHSKLAELAEDAPAIEFINAMFSEAMARRASDIHIEPFKGDMQIRLRIDGTLNLWKSIPALRFAAIASRIKLLCGMDIAERRIPQDGRHSLRISGRDVDIRASCLPGVWGESIVLRFLGRASDLPTLAKLGVNDAMIGTLEKLIHQPSGLLLVAGPTGSGKTTTVYKLLEQLNDGSHKIITIEDPVEIDLPGVIQVNVRPDIGLEFATGLRSMLRQDPDIIFVGEIRDSDTALMATRAALTGHLVISTVHTASASASVARLLDLGVESYLLAEALNGVIAQRLLRRRSQVPGVEYSGRIGVYEIMEMNGDLRSAIRDNQPQSVLEDIAQSDGFRPMRDDAKDKVSSGLTDMAELFRVLGT